MKKLTSAQKRQLVKALNESDINYVLVRPNYFYANRRHSLPNWLTGSELMLRIHKLYPNDRSNILSCTNYSPYSYYAPLISEIIDIYPQSRLEVEYPELLI